MPRDKGDEEPAPEPPSSSSTSKAEAESNKTNEAALRQKLSRKRTKSGCLTCRKRRIKCGEERPVCKNCIKSRRHCEGYVQPVNPFREYHRSLPGGSMHTNFIVYPTAGPITPVIVPTTNDFPALNQLRPRPPQYEPGFDVQRQPMAGYGQYMNQLPAALTGSNRPILMPNQQPPFSIAPFTQPNLPGISPVEMMGFDAATMGPEPIPSGGQPIASDLGRPGFYQPYVHVQPGPSSIRASYDYPHDVKDIPVMPLQLSPLGMGDNVQGRPWVDTGHLNHTTSPFHIIPPSNQLSRAFSISHPLPAHHQQHWDAGGRGFDQIGSVEYAPGSNSAGPHYGAFHPSTPAPFSRSAPTTPYGYEQESQIPLRNSPTRFLSNAAVETQDDDYYDVTSQEEMDDDDNSVSDGRSADHRRTLSNLLARTQITPQGSQMRRYDTFIYHGILSDYNVEWVANPLRNQATARVFAHFISVTGPMLSIYERHPKNSSVLFARELIPFSQQGLWTYTMPMAALHHQGLLHAMLALASLHIARLQGASTTPSMQHYAWSLKRIHKCVGRPNKRLKLTTIAASMLLGFYEVMTADHIKWNTHLAGSKQLYIETDFVKMTQEFRRLKLERSTRDELRGNARIDFTTSFGQDELLDQMYDVDDSVVSRLAGREIRYGDHGSVEASMHRIPPDLNLSEYASLKDLYWWYCKQDVIQSILGGNPLLMDFSRWASCPPRAPLGRPDAVHGSFDHLLLLLGRLSDFASRDRVRKLEQIKANGDQWRPAPGMKMPRPPQPQGNTPVTPVSTMHIKDEVMDPIIDPTTTFPSIPSAAMPQFFGMTPQPLGNLRMPASYMPNQPPQTQAFEQDLRQPLEMDLQAALEAALEEYGQIRAALMSFSNSLGESFEPLTSEFQPPLPTPFGPALSYRSYNISCLWAWYNMVMIIAIRSHPHMPPAAHMAAGIAAQDTAFFANEIGRITAAITPGPVEEPLNPILGSALNESCLPSFFAAVQYQDPAQRHYTVTRIFSIARKTGWGSAELIANGCETAWVRTAEAGRGPPYERVVRAHSSNNTDPRLNGSWEQLDPNSPPDGKDEWDRRLVKVNANARLNWAIGVMGTEADIGKS